MPKRRLALTVFALAVTGFTMYVRVLRPSDQRPAAQVSDAGAWTEVSSMPTPRSEMVSAALEGVIYVSGGLGPDYSVLTTLEAYDTTADTWTTLAPMPLSLHHLSIAADEDERRIYVTGGFVNDFNSHTDAAWSYDPAADEWTPIADMPASRAAHTSTVIGGLLYVTGGVPDGTSLWAYNPVTDSWDTSLAPMPTAREHLASAATGGLWYVIGGRWNGGANVATAEVYDPATDTWTALPDMPFPRGGLTAGAMNGMIHVTGGEIFNVGLPDTFNQHDAFNIETGEWLTLPYMPSARHGLASSAVSGRWYVIGGGLEAAAQTYVTLSDLVEVYTPDPIE